jgi:multiple sugar transport system ATP-binding protein
VRAPACFLMDEPLSSLDAKLREDLRIELKRIQRELGATILYVTHDQIEAMTLADRIGVLDKGRLLQLAPPRAIYGQPVNLDVARRLGSPPINVMPPAVLSLPAMPPGATMVAVRPEDVRLTTAGIPAVVDQVEPLGAETVVRLKARGVHIHALLVGPGRLTPGQEAHLAVAPEAVLFFDEAGRRVAAPA